ncbi:YgiT-type zinc finger protein [Picosynechococcus sp. PCC 11901]|uniref:YgiT-type zinc finger protein n=1 Tax=Picosynechococcus sp. PCC 11901 TaxID=2579791 RepID=UPI0030DC0327
MFNYLEIQLNEVKIFQCHICQSKHSKQEVTSEAFQTNGKFYLVENIPVEVCQQCGEETFSRETTEKIRKMLHEDQQPARTITMDVFSYQAAS